MNIIFTSVGRRSYLIKYFKEALGGAGKIHAANSSEISPAFQVADYAVVMPLIYDSNYIPFLMKYCKDNCIDAIISLFDIDLPVLSKHKKELEDIGVRVIVSDTEVIEICNDKWRTYKFLVDNGFNVPPTFIRLKDAIDAVQEGIIHYPMIVKPRWGMGSIAIFEAENNEELKIFYDKAKRNIDKTYLKYESAEDIEESVLIQEKLIGQENGLDIINDLCGNYQTTICKVKYAMRSGETDCAVTIDSDVLKGVGEKLSSCLHHIGNLDCDVFMVDDKPYVLEMNARFGGGYPFSHMAGVNLPKAIISWLSGEEPDNSLLKEEFNVMSQKDISMIRLYLTPDVRIVYEPDETEVYRAVSEMESLLVPSLVQRGVDIKGYTQKLAKLGKTWLVIDSHEKICGILAAYLNDEVNHVAYLSFLAVAPECRGMHYAEMLLQTAEKEAGTCGMEKFKLEVRKDNSNAIGFYCSQGYEVVEEATKDSYYMSKML